MSNIQQAIIYRTDEGGVAIVHPLPEILETITIDEVAKKDVPTGKRFKIINVSELPNDRTYRDAWTIDEALLTDGVGE